LVSSTNYSLSRLFEPFWQRRLDLGTSVGTRRSLSGPKRPAILKQSWACFEGIWSYPLRLSTLYRSFGSLSLICVECHRRPQQEENPAGWPSRPLLKMGFVVDITCLCGKSKGKAEVAAESLPAETMLCHCNICRYSSGVLCVSYLTLASPPEMKDSLQTYQSSAKMQRMFCSVCGSHLFAHSSELNEWYLTTGTIETLDPTSGAMMETTKLMQHEFVSDTLDGGLAPCLTKAQDRNVASFAQGPEQELLTFDTTDGLPTLSFATKQLSGKQLPTSTASGDHLHASCHCGGVQYMISRPNERSSLLSSPWPDLLVPYHSQSSRNEEDVKWWLRSDGKKYLAGTCACRSCRLGSGFSIQTWAFVPKGNLATTRREPLSFAMGTLKQYGSKPGIYREFCGTCGATVFWHCDERPDLVDVSVGLLRAEEGSRADTWIEWWTERTSFKEDAIDVELTEALESGLSNIRH
jgi:hypothetical protein